MSTLPDNRSLSEVTIPGTHNTAALYGGVYAECQSWSLPSQLQAGVRFLDVRVHHLDGVLNIHHGVMYQKAHFGDVLRDVVNFLNKYPSETVLMRIKEEQSKTNSIYTPVVKYIHRYARWDLLWHSRQVPTMGQARGKLIILQDFYGTELGMNYKSMDIADDWKVPSLAQVPDKWQSAYNHLEAAAVGSKAQMFLTFSSGAGISAFPRSVAQRINPKLYKYLMAKKNKNQCFGIICMDFPSAPMIQSIINFQLKEDEEQDSVL
ncbi:1-phosphatidylinositol phosphodiesterase-like isoform X2 [Dunckerocampus dactyliophorus]|nr:1-phosphatidylinositol phosphodiesterase-like isoform X2 [Dunckerocampus dactyliophorus]XP_054620022.1 1-phosphatidylinositol phosphodiesterase-like isoform X2 [Dunckerocampus dactyliophorus]